jgi:hypothetical protein
MYVSNNQQSTIISMTNDRAGTMRRIGWLVGWLVGWLLIGLDDRIEPREVSPSTYHSTPYSTIINMPNYE